MEPETTDMTAEAEDFTEFAEALGVDSGYQTGNGSEEASGEAAEETGDQAPEEGREAEAPGSEAPPEDVEKPQEGESQSFTIKVNHEEKSLSLEEMTALAQKGSDYDRVKGQLQESRQETQVLREQLEGNREALEMLGMISQNSGVSVQELLENLYVSMQRSKGMDEAAAREALRADRLQRENAALKEVQTRKKDQEDSAAARAQREVAEFREQFPGVELTGELTQKLMADVQGGMSLANAYRKLESARKDAAIAELERKLQAAQQNQKNKAASTGSQSDSGGRRVKSDFDDFSSALFG